MGRARQELVFLCLGCGKTEAVQISRAIVLKAVVRYYYPPKDWAILYPPWDFPTRSGLCAECIQKQTRSPIHVV